jgi:hypothetical protein
VRELFDGDLSSVQSNERRVECTGDNFSKADMTISKKATRNWTRIEESYVS